MKKIYNIYLSESSLNAFQKRLNNLEQILLSKDFKEYIGKKCMEALKQITTTKLTSYNEENIDTSYYASRNQMKIEGDTIILFNDSMIDISTKNMKETTKANYPAQLSLAKIVEYGIGYTGSISTDQTEVEDWEYDVNNHGYKGWYYTDDNGEVHWTNGFEGRLIFLELKNTIMKNASKWISEYIDIKLK